MRLVIDVMHTQIRFDENEGSLRSHVHKVMHEELGVKADGYQFSPAYKSGYWDGIIDFYNKDNDTFPTGLLPQVEEILGKLQATMSRQGIVFQFEMIDDRPDKFMEVTEMDSEIKLNGDNNDTLTLRDYQYDAVKSIIQNQTGIINVSTGGGKCVSYHTRLLTADKGYKSFKEIFEEHNIDPNQPSTTIPNTFDIQLINRYGQKETPSHLTVNGVKHVNKVITDRGLNETITDNHPLLTVAENGTFVWKEARELSLGDWVVSRKGDNIFGSNETCKPREAYALGLLATKDKEVPHCILEAPRETQLAFLSGYFNCFNCGDLHKDTIEAVSASESLLEQVQLLLLNMGYASRVKEKKVEGCEQNQYGITVDDTDSAKLITELTFADSSQNQQTIMNNLLDKNFMYSQIVAIEDAGYEPTFDLHMPETHSFIANGIINHNTEVASGLIQQILPALESGERIAFFTGSSSIFTQSIERVEKRLGIKVGMYGAGKKDIQQVTFVMIPTITSAISADPEAKLKLTAKERMYKKIAKEIAPKFLTGFNQRGLLEGYIRNFQVRTKADLQLKHELEEILYSCGSNKQVVMKMRNYQAEYEKVVEKKNGKVLKKHKEAKEFLESIAVMIVDEAHHTSSDTWYKALTSCHNAQYRMALTGSIDMKNHVLWQRLQAIFGTITSRVSNDTLINLGHSAKPKITIFPIIAPTDIATASYMDAYKMGIVDNIYRNSLIAKLTKKMYDAGNGVLVIINRIEHGETLSELLDAEGVPHYFIHGELDTELRDEKLQEMRDGKLKVMISSSIIDEGVDISGINTLILGAGGKSLRQTLQRIGRGLRKKKTGENKVAVFDFYDLTNKHLKKHSEERRKIYVKEQFEIVDIPLPTK